MRRVWDKIILFVAISLQVRRVIYSNNATESVNAQLHKILKTRGHFSSGVVATKLIRLGCEISPLTEVEPPTTEVDDQPVSDSLRGSFYPSRVACHVTNAGRPDRRKRRSVVPDYKRSRGVPPAAWQELS